MTFAEECQIITPKQRMILHRQNILAEPAQPSALLRRIASCVSKRTDKRKKIAPTNAAAVPAALTPAASPGPAPLTTIPAIPTNTPPNQIVVEGWEVPLRYRIDNSELPDNICKAVETMDPSNRDILVLMLASIGGLTAQMGPLAKDLAENPKNCY